MAHQQMHNLPPELANTSVDPLDCDTYDPKWHVSNPAMTTSAFWLGALTALFNMLVMGVMGWSMKKGQGQNIPRILVSTLAFTDFSLGAFTTLTQAFRYLWGYCGTGGYTVCAGQAFLLNLIIVSSSFIVVLMSAERFCALKLPFRYNRIFTIQNTLIMITVIFAYSIFLALLPFLGINHYANGDFGCDFDWRDTTTGGQGYNYFFGIQGLLLMPIIVVLNVSVLREINRMTTVAPSGPAGQKNSNDQDVAALKLQRRFAVLTLLTSAAFLICNAPIMVRLIEYQTGHVFHAFPNFVVKRMHISNSLVNPCLSLFFYLSNIKWRTVCGCEKDDSEA